MTEIRGRKRFIAGGYCGRRGKSHPSKRGRDPRGWSVCSQELDYFKWPLRYSCCCRLRIPWTVITVRFTIQWMQGVNCVSVTLSSSYQAIKDWPEGLRTQDFASRFFISHINIQFPGWTKNPNDLNDCESFHADNVVDLTVFSRTRSILSLSRCSWTRETEGKQVLPFVSRLSCITCWSLKIWSIPFLFKGWESSTAILLLFTFFVFHVLLPHDLHWILKLLSD